MEQGDGITLIALVISVALLLGLGFLRLGHSPVLGYIFSGIMLGPSGLNIISEKSQVDTLSELGILLLLFLVGVELNFKTFKSVWLKSTIYAITQIVLSIFLMNLLSPFLGGSKNFALLLGFVISLSSTAIVIKLLDGIGELKSELGQLVIGILICQDLAIVPMIVILNNCEASFFNVELILKLFLSVCLIVGLIRYLSHNKCIKLPFAQLTLGDRELTPITCLTYCFGAAALTGLIGLSSAYGAFLAGILLGNTRERFLIVETTKPIQNVLMMIFFLSVGLLLNFQFVYQNFFVILLLLISVTVIKTIFNIVTFKVLRLSWSDSFLSGVLLSQLGEFSFLMSTVAFNSNVVTDKEKMLIMTLTVLSLTLSPFWFLSSKRLQKGIFRIHYAFKQSRSRFSEKK